METSQYARGAACGNHMIKTVISIGIPNESHISALKTIRFDLPYFLFDLDFLSLFFDATAFFFSEFIEILQSFYLVIWLLLPLTLNYPQDVLSKASLLGFGKFLSGHFSTKTHLRWKSPDDHELQERFEEQLDANLEVWGWVASLLVSFCLQHQSWCPPETPNKSTIPHKMTRI